MLKSKKIKPVIYKRNIEDAPFYSFTYQHDELPIDPAKEFIQHQINKLKQMRPVEFVEDLDLHTNIVAMCFSNDILVVPSWIELVQDHKDFPSLTKDILSFGYLKDDDGQKPTEFMLWKITIELTSLYIKRKTALVQDNFRRIGVRFSDYGQRPYTNFKKRGYAKKPRKLVTCGDETKIRTCEELRAELNRMSKVIDELIEPDLKRKRNNEVEINPIKRCPGKKKIIDKNIKKMRQREEALRVKYQSPLQPNDPELQKLQLLRKYEIERDRRTIIFTNENYQFRARSLKLISRMSVLHIEHYPSNLILRIIPQIDRRIPYLREAYAFIKSEMVHWPNVFPEIIFLDYLFDFKNHVPLSEAVLLVVLLLDLQEDFRFGVKRDFLKYLLGFEFERRILWLEPEPPQFPIMSVRAPMLWRSSVQVSKNRIEEILMTTHPVLMAISSLWRQLYEDLVIVDFSKLFEENIPFHADKVTQFLKHSCIVMKDILINDWLPRVADAIDILRPYWRNLVSFHDSSTGRCIYLFQCIHGLMSHQLTNLIQNSIKYLYSVLVGYRGGNCDLSRIRIKRFPFMTIAVSVVGKSFVTIEHDEIDQYDKRLYEVSCDDPMLGCDEFFPVPDRDALNEANAKFIIRNSGKMIIDPCMEDLEEIFIGYFKHILRVGYKIPRIEYFMTKDEGQRGYLHVMQEDHVDMLDLYTKIREVVQANLIGPTLYLYPIYSYYFPLLAGKIKAVTEHIFSQKRIPELPVVNELIERFNQLLSGVYGLQNFVPLNLFMLDNRSVNATLIGLIDEIKNFVLNYFVNMNQVENRRICDEFEDISLKAGERPKETQEVVALQNYLNECREERLYKLKTEIKNVVSQRVLFLLKHTLLETEDINLNTRTFLWPAELDQVLDLSAARLSVIREGLEEALKERRATFEKYVAQEAKKMNAFRMKSIRDVITIEDLKEKVKIVDELMDILEKCSREAALINREEHLLQMDTSSFPVLIDIIDKMDVIEKLWRTAYQFDQCYENWYFGYFMGLDAKLIGDEVDTMWKTIIKLIKQLVGNPTARRVAEQIRLKIDKFKNYVPVLEAICRQGMSERHWEQISQELGTPITPELYPTLSAMVDIGIMNIFDKLDEISNAAGKEFELNAQLIEMQKGWEDVKFDLLPYRDSDTHILASLDDIQTLLDDHILKSQAMRGSPYVGALGTYATDWEEKLILMQDILDVWVQVQSTWMYLEPIFSSEDIMKQMPVEGRNFKGVDRIFRKIMKHTSTDRRVIQATDYPQLLAILQGAFFDLEQIQKGLNMYLEKKRLYFARFFFLSNDELLEILSETKDPLRVQPHLKKCFEGINSLEFDQQTEINGMISVDMEMVPFVKKINPNAANGLVEKWLKEVMNAMFESMLAQIRISFDNYWTERRGDWVLKYPGQAVLAVSAMTWTEEVEDAIKKQTLDAYYDKCEYQIGELIEHVRGGLLKASFTVTIEALIVLDVHARDIVKLLVDKEVKANDDFNWHAQLRYYWRIDSVNKQDYVCVSMVATEVRYGMEYLGNQPRLVVTPLTDRCYRTLMGAIKVNLGGAPEGPAGTGKTETCKDLAKAVAKKCVVFNCSSELDYKAIGKFLKGLAQSGAWACFDEFNRMELEVLSVIAQQILTIQRAISRKVVKFNFEETILQLDPTCSIFITMNPGYAGRTELPDNLKMLFRTVAMMVPDYAMIGEISLYSTGFSQARPLSQKIVHTYKLCSEQLSSQSHYDYGMRAIKSVLIASASLRKLYATLPEPDIVLRAIIDVNLPKFLQDDIQLFEGIYADLFPDTEVFQPSRVDIMNWLLKQIESRNLQPKPWFIEKVMQIYEMMLVRHGIMICGGTMAGKTTAYQILAESLKAVSNDINSKTSENGALYRIINPKAITIGQLYGNFDPVSHEWSDGVLAKTFREMANSGASERQWIIFDGPVDAVWIENLNTTLDDNKKLCLMSGEIIQMSNKMNLIFEPVDLEQASPATVSRVGMIYMEPDQLGWDSYHKSFLNDLVNAGVTEIYLALYESLVDWLIPSLLDIINSCQCLLKLTAMHCYRMLTIFFLDFYGRNENPNQIWFQQIFLFCMLWSFGSTATVECRRYIDQMLRKILYGANEDHPRPKHFTLNRGQMFPEKMLVFDYYFDEKENWWPWFKEEVNLPNEASFSELLVPTKESGYVSYWLNICIRKSLPSMLIGPTGTGKSAAVLSTLFDLPKAKFVINTINFSARTTSTSVQDIVMSKLDRRRKGVFGPPVGRQCLVFADDIGMPARDEYGSQPPLELIRQFIDHGHWSDLKDTTNLEIVDLMFIAAMGLVGGSNFIYPRLYRHMFVVGIDAFEDNTIFRIFSSLSDWHFRHDYVDNVARMSKNMCSAVLEVFRKASDLFLPTPAKSHYLFSLRDITRVYQGVILVPPARLTTSEKLTLLWIHEMYRVFCDRLNDPIDRRDFLSIMRDSCKSNMRMPMEQAFANRLEKSENVTEMHIRDLMFGNYMEPDAYPKIYDELENLDKLENVMTYYLSEYNLVSNTPMDLVLFRFAIEHISRVSRILQMPRGNVLMVGLGGSGRRSTAKLAASMLDIDLFMIEIHKLYSFNDWHDDIKALLLGAGLNAKPTIFLFSDSQAKDEYFIEDISSLLNTGELTNLFPSEDKATIIEAMQVAAKTLGKQVDSTPVALYAYFIERVKEYLHIGLAFSPIGDSFKQRIRMFPSLINCCTIDWFTTWPDDALLRVAESFIKAMNINNIETPATAEDVSSQESRLSEMEKLPDRELADNEKSIVDVMLTINSSVIAQSNQFFLELGRKNYVTPTSYLEMMKSFRGLYDKKYNEIVMKRDRYTTGLEKLDNAAGQVAGMQENLYALQPQLKKTSEETEQIMVIIERDTAEAEKKKEVVGADEAAANEAAAASQAIKDDCESDLQEAIPALEAALSALDTLKPADITVVKSMKNPPAGVKLVLEAVCVMKGLKPDRKPDASGRMYEDYWGVSLRMLGDMKFLESLKSFDKNNIPAPVMKKIRDVYIADRDFIPEKIAKISTACEGLCRWVRAMEVYDRVARIVAPKKIALAEAENELQLQMEKLNEKKEELLVILNKLQKLNDGFAEKSKEKKNLEDEIDNCEKKLVRAEKLIGGLGGEKTRWSESARTLDASLVNVIGDVLLAAGCIAYLGPFTALYRTDIITNWNKLCVNKTIPCSPVFTLSKTLGSDIEIRQWAICGLPIDNFSIENGIIVTNARRWPLMIDPQVQANNWVKNLEKDNNLKVFKLTDDNYMRTVENAVKFGSPVLLENLGESIDFGLFPILEKNIIKQRGGYVIKFGDNLIEYNHNFRFYMTTCLGNPHYLPETAVMVTLLNFMITEHGLQQQLLTNVVIQERPELQEKKEQLILESAKNRSTLYNVETKILQVLSSSEGNILEDENAIDILTSSKILSEDIITKQAISEVTEKEIDEARQLYIPVANHSSVLFFSLTELPNIDPMYHFSLTWFLNLFIQTILKAPKSEVLQERLQSLNDFFTKSIYENVCRSLFEKHKLIFAFSMCLGIMRSLGNIADEHLKYLLQGNVDLSNPHKNPAPDWLTEKAWLEIVGASNLDGLENFFNRFSNNLAEWKVIYDADDPNVIEYPAPFNNIEQVLKMIILKALRPDKITPAVKLFISRNIGPKFVEPPSFNLNQSYEDSNPLTPLIFLLSSGSDPMANIVAFSKEKMMYDKFKQMSLGQGQGPKAIKLLTDALKQGNWVILQNIHVAESWMDDFEKFCNDLPLLDSVHQNFRLWCTSYPSKIFPVSVLQNSVKMTNEPPKGLKLNIIKLLNSDPLVNDKFFSNAFGGEVGKQWLRGVFSLLFFHSIVQGRKEFGPLGWNIPYEFNDSDLRISLMQLKMFLKQYGFIPFEGHSYLTGECNYGGRVTDDKDRRTLITILADIYNRDAIMQDKYNLSESGIYYIPLFPNRVTSIEYIETLPDAQTPEVFGLHENADIVKNITECLTLFDGALRTQAKLKGKAATGETAVGADPVLSVCDNILARLPELFDMKMIAKNNPITYMNSMNTVLRQEAIRFNNLIRAIRTSLIDTRRAILGQISMIPQLEQVYTAIKLGRIPKYWAAKSYPSLKTLGSYVNDFMQRIHFFNTWIDHGEPVCFWISGFYFTQSFLTAVLQNFCRRHKIQIDLIEILYDITEFENDVQERDEVGFYAKGIFLEAARWNRETKLLDEPTIRILFDTVPVIIMKPIMKEEIDEKDTSKYKCPVYKTSERRGTLSTTGHSTNFVSMIPLKTDKQPAHWVKRGTASLLQLTD